MENNDYRINAYKKVASKATESSNNKNIFENVNTEIGLILNKKKSDEITD